MHVLRTPDERFHNLPDYPFEPHYLTVSDFEGGELRIHYLDEGQSESQSRPTMLLLHGEPTWSYLYRHMIPPLVAAGFRVVAPDLVGFGKSDKPSQKSDYTYRRHVAWMKAVLFERLELNDVTLFCQDWGSLIGLRLVADQPERFARIVLANGGLPTGDEEMSNEFKVWLTFSKLTPVLPVGRILQIGTTTALGRDVLSAYNAPFPTEAHKAGAHVFPSLVPVRPDDPAAPANRRAWAVLEKFDKPFLTAFSDQDPITRGAEQAFRTRVPGARGQPHVTTRGGGHFLQEDRPDYLARLIVEFVNGGVAKGGIVNTGASYFQETP